jgi:hypothetical protein
MTYKDLLDALNNLPAEQLEEEVLIEVSGGDAVPLSFIEDGGDVILSIDEDI